MARQAREETARERRRGSVPGATARPAALTLPAMLTRQAPSSPALAGMLLALGGGAALSVNDMAIKALSGGYPLHQVVLTRALIGLAGVAAALLLARGLRGAWDAVRPRRVGLHALRAACVLASNLSYFLGLAALPLADGVAIFFVAPLLMTALSVPLLGERVGPRRWAAVAVGLLGVLVMLRPGPGFVQPASLLVLLSALAYALTNILTRRMGPTEGAVAMSVSTQGAFVLLSLAVGAAVGDGRLAAGAGPSLTFLLRAWAWPPLADWPLFLATGCATTLGGLMLAQAYRLSPPALVAPFEYAAMPLAVLWGVLAFGTWPDRVAWLGIALICGAGLYALWREARAREA